jgi:putative methyltransferase (TIGR04325 family)
MYKRIKYYVKKITPLFLIELYSIKNRNLKFIGHYQSWNVAKNQCRGYDDPRLVQKILDSCLKVKNGEAKWERDSVLFNEIEFNWPLSTVLMWCASLNSNKINIVDFGGSLGTAYFQNLIFLNHLGYLEWNIIEQNIFVKAGNEHFKTDKLRFIKDFNEIKSEKIDFILFGSSLQYLEDPYKHFLYSMSLKPDFIMIDKTPFSELDLDVISKQVVSKNIIESSYPIHIFSFAKFIKIIKQDWQIISIYDTAEVHLTSRGLKFTFKGIILKRK